MTICVIDNDGSFLRETGKAIRDFDPNAEVVCLESLDEFIEYASDKSNIDRTSIILTDLEFTPYVRTGDGLTPQDYVGRDEVLPFVRSIAPWIPVLLVSNYVDGHSEVLSKTTPWGFDGVLAKSFFAETTTNSLQWNSLITTSTENRLAALTGRSISDVKNYKSKSPELEYGESVNNEFLKFGISKTENLIKKFGFDAETITVDKIIQGFSGISVVRLNCVRNGRVSSWIFKFGIRKSKINEEIQCHRHMFELGYSRKFSVPPYWWNVVCVNDLAAIAYEFDEDGVSFLDNLHQNGWERSSKVILGTLKEFYRDCSKSSAVPRRILEQNISFSNEESLSDPVIQNLFNRSEDANLDCTVTVLKGPQHGDLHCRNLLVSNGTGLLIDFANFKKEGYPIVDCAKFILDAWVFSDIRVRLPNLIDGTFFNDPMFEGIGRCFSISDKLSADEKHLFSLCIRAYAQKYLTYPDVADCKKREIIDFNNQ